MAPAICDGDTVRVKICTDGNLIKAGPKNSTHPGDIIVYCAGAITPTPSSMWACGRAINKYLDDGEWWFKTQLDSSPNPDSWEVPEHYLLGIIDQVTHSPNGQYSTSGQSLNEYHLGLEDLLTLAFDLLTGITIGVILAAIIFKTYRNRKRVD
jgi:hypothetical protein